MVRSRYGSNRSLKLAVSYDLREGSFEALFNIRGALDCFDCELRASGLSSNFYCKLKICIDYHEILNKA